MAHKLTVLIPCKNERMNIRPCIEAAREIADEVIVADSGSTDDTLDIVRGMGGCRIIEREYVNSADFKNWAIPQTEHEWILVIDSDERVTSELAAEIKALLAGEPDQDGYFIYRKNHFFGHPIQRCGWERDDVLRLFRKSVCHYKKRRVHADMIVDTGKIGRLKGKFLHYTYWSLDQYFEKFGRYTTWSAEDIHENGRKAGFLSLAFRPWIRFLKQYVLKLGFLEGRKGLILCGLAAFTVFTKYAKVWAMDEGLPQPDPEADHASQPAPNSA